MIIRVPDNMTDTLRALDAELVADRREVSPDAFTTSDYARANGCGESTALRRLRRALDDGKVERTWKAVGPARVQAWRRK